MVAKGIDDFRLNKILLGDSIDTAYVVLRLAPVGRHCQKPPFTTACQSSSIQTATIYDLIRG
jgi:hypothetical protein